MADGGEGCGQNRTWPVCSKPSGNTAHGLCDMAGNVWEWTNDWYGKYQSGDLSNPTGPSGGSMRVERSGSWHNGAHALRAFVRRGNAPHIEGDNLGFRCARSFQEAAPPPESPAPRPESKPPASRPPHGA